MNEFDVLNHLKALCKERNWSLYKLAKEADIPYSTLNTMFNKNNVPTISTLTKLCNGLGITIAQFFSNENVFVDLSEDQIEILKLWNEMDSQSKRLVITYILGILRK